MSRLSACRAKADRAAPWLAAAVFIAISGCAAVWQPTHGRLEKPGWSMQIPAGWMRLTTPSYDMFSKDGPYLQYILVQDRPLSQGFQFTRRTVEADMLPHEMARVIIDNLQADPQVRDFTLLANGPAMVGGRPGFKLIYTYQDRQGVDMQTVYYGTVHAAHFFNLRYTAVQRHYFPADQDTFEQVAQSLHLPSDA